MVYVVIMQVELSAALLFFASDFSEVFVAVLIREFSVLGGAAF